jgi:two-component sensor histidine kinase
MAKILIVDDDQFLAEHIGYMLAAFGYSSQAITNSQDLFPALAGDKFDLILLDINMPGINGITQLKRLKAEPEYAMIPVIMLTGIVDDQLQASCFEYGAADFITKPIKKLVLEARVQAALGTKAYIEKIEQQKKILEKRTVELHQANELLQQEITERRWVEEELKKHREHLEELVEERTAILTASLQEKDVLLKEIHHRVKNNLQVISSLLYLQSQKVKQEPVFEIFRESQNRVKSMALIHEKLYQSRDLAQIDFAEYVHKLTTYLLQSYNVSTHMVQVRLKVEGAVLLGVDRAIPCGLIVNELVSNALKYAFPAHQNGEIYVELYLEPAGRLTLIVGDNGVGFPPDLDFRQTDSLGLQLVNNLVRQLDGVIELQNVGGATFKVILAHPHPA